MKKAAVTFSDNELRVIRAICLQLTIKEIAEQLFLSAPTVDGCIKRVKEKTEAKNFVGIALYAIKNGIVQLEDI